MSEMTEMTKPELPEGALAIWSEYERADGVCVIVDRPFSKEQVLAIRDAGIAYGMELAAQIADGEHFGGQNDDDLGWTGCAAFIAAAIRAKKEWI